MVDEQQEFIYCKEHWSGDSRDGVMVRGEGCHFFRMLPQGLILEAYELYESEEGEEVATPLPEMHNISWINDLGFEDLSDLDRVKESEFTRVKSMCGSKFE